MRIAVLVKHVVDSTEVRFDKNTGELRLRGLPEKISDYDKHAIEAAVRIKSELNATVTAFSFGQKDATKSLKEAVAMGADEGVLISDLKANQIYDPMFTAQVLSRAIEDKGGADLVLCGAMTEDITNHITGTSVAFLLDCSHIPNVTDIELVEEKKIDGVFEMDGTETKFQAEMPVVLSVTRKLNEPRLATKIQILKVPMKKVTTITLADLEMTTDGDSPSSVIFESFTPITKERKRVVLDGEISDITDELIQKFKQENVL